MILVDYRLTDRVDTVPCKVSQERGGERKEVKRKCGVGTGGEHDPSLPYQRFVV